MSRWNLDRAIEIFGNGAIDELSRDDIQDARIQIASQRGNVTANRWLSSLRTSLDEATARGHIKGNPASGIKKLREALNNRHCKRKPKGAESGFA